MVGSKCDFRFSPAIVEQKGNGKFPFFGRRVPDIHIYVNISDLFDPISAARRQFGPLVSGQMLERVPFWV